MTEVRRRDFLKILGVGGAAAATVGCGTGDVERLIPYVVSPDDSVPGVSTYFATTCRECSTGCGILAEARDGRAFKLEGNPAHPVSRGAICSRGLAAVQGLYNPDRFRQPMARRDGALVPVSWDDALALFTERLGAVRSAGTAADAVVLTEPARSASAAFVREWLEAHGLPAPIAFDPLFDASVVRAHREMYGAAWPTFDFRRARLVVSFGADFLDGWGASVPQQLEFAAARAQLASAPRHIYIGPRRSLTGLNADSWIAARPGSELAIAQALLGALGAGGSGSLQQAALAGDVPVATLEVLTAELRAARPSIVLAGASTTNGYALALAAGALNRTLGNIGATILADRALLGVDDAATVAEMADVARRMVAGQVPLLIVHGTNPVYALPAALGFADAMERVPFKVSFSTYPDETTVRCDLVLPDHHPLEQWDMIQSLPDSISMQQPAMDPVFATRAMPDVLLDVARRDPTVALRFPERNFREWVMGRFPGNTSQFTDALTEGLASGTLPVVVAAPRPTPPAAPPPGEQTGGDFHLIVYPHPMLGAGAGANKAWLQEIPDPVTKISWQSTVELHPSTAARLGIEAGDLVEVTTDAGSVTAPAYLYPGIRADAVAIAAGRGHTAYGRYAEGVGVNPLAVLPVASDPRSGALAWSAARVRVRKADAHETLVSTEGSARQHGRGIAQAVLVADLPRAGAVVMAATGGERADEIAPGGEALGGQEQQRAPAAEHESGAEHEFMGAAPSAYLPGLRAPVANDAEGELGDPGSIDLGMYDPDHWSKMAHRRWAMAIDLARCTGCSACITACYSENNIPTVGAASQATAFPGTGAWGANIVRGREMTWIRLERYYEGGEAMAREFDPEFETRFLPMLCQHCGNAPCEPVCPVYATYHAPDGLNVQVYNRCVGTRYCSNNCPYKVRYFNWFGYGEPDRPQYAWPEPLNWALNPDVTVRGKGVMEKCTFCIQRIREAENRAALERRPVMADEFTTACAQACPSRAIVFGDAADPAWSVARSIDDPRTYHVFEELKAFPAVLYLKKVNHPALAAPGMA